MESQLFTKDETANNESFKSVGSVVIQKDTWKFTRDSMMTRTKKNVRSPSSRIYASSLLQSATVLFSFLSI